MDDNDTMNPTEDKEHHTPAAHDYGMRNSSLHTLPAELRNHIWELVFDNLWETTTIALSRTERHLGGSHNFAPLLTCKQINREAYGFAWRDVKASVGRDDRPLLNLEDLLELTVEAAATPQQKTMGINWEYSGICVTHVKSGTALQYTDRSDWDVQWV
ncbi:hypothetical protein B0A48_08915 [Cryoendolithus antarcticus]|uniref:Uncharacterized protein n=1 Tax=Cryoendolithus antarcticus TaxID=1507870 RepID=A0A1V8T4H7_9PEZI|nr:hypothetical protein B0A48_08915 [Cryoendolithus antarcticus]